MLRASSLRSYWRKILSPHSASEPPAAKAVTADGQHQGIAAESSKPVGMKPRRMPDRRNLEAAGACIEIRQSDGHRHDTRTMIALEVVSRTARLQAAANRQGRDHGIHAGEIEGKDTVLMLIRDMTVSAGSSRVGWITRSSSSFPFSTSTGTNISALIIVRARTDRPQPAFALRSARIRSRLHEGHPGNESITRFRGCRISSSTTTSPTAPTCSTT